MTLIFLTLIEIARIGTNSLQFRLCVGKKVLQSTFMAELILMKFDMGRYIKKADITTWIEKLYTLD